MNSEELEVSLRTEFENYLKSLLAEMRQEISQLQEKVTTELERHKSQLDEVFEVAISNFEKERELDVSFKETVVEHLRLSRDEGAQITAMAIARAEEMEKETSSSSAGIKEIYEAVGEISNKTTQSEILKTLVHHATNFAPRGAFFIIKNEHLVGWRVFGKEKGAAEEKVREVFLPVSSNSVLSEAVKSLATVGNATGGYTDDTEVLQKLEFGTPQRMVAIPLVARGRGVAVLYADYGNEGGEINIEALETLVRVAGLTVEVLASNKAVFSGKKPVAKKVAAVSSEEESSPMEMAESSETVEEVSSEPTSNYQAVVSEPEAEPTSETSFESENFTAPATFVEESVAETSYQSSFERENFFAPPTEPIEEVAEEKPVEETAEFVADDSEIEEVRPNEAVTEFESAVATTEPEVETAAETSEAEPEMVVNESQTVEYSSFETTSWSADDSKAEEVETTPSFVEETVQEEVVSAEKTTEFSYQPETEEKYPAFETTSWSAPTEAPTTEFSAQEFATNFAKETDPAEYAKDFSYQVESNETANVEAPIQTVETESFVVPAQEFVPTKEQTYGSFEVENGKSETVSEPLSTAPPKSRLSERNVDLPIEVGEDERRLHNDARRFARLLVSEIKLYNEQKVKEGRESSDLYERLKEAIDRSREMYDKRVQPPVAAKFDYFHYELVNALAEGDDNKLGSGYPGSAV